MKKKKVRKGSGDPRERAATAKAERRILRAAFPVPVPQVPESRVFKLKDFIRMDNPSDVSALREAATELKSEYITDDFLAWYEEKYGAYPDEIESICFLSFPFFEALLERGEKDVNTGAVNIDEVISFLNPSEDPNPYRLVAWGYGDRHPLADNFTEYLRFRGYLENFDDFKNLDEYTELELDEEYEFAENQPVTFT